MGDLDDLGVRQWLENPAVGIQRQQPSTAGPYCGPPKKGIQFLPNDRFETQA